ncbi:MAG: hypothetical protein ACC657_11880 [Thiohalomonadales bacterium]
MFKKFQQYISTILILILLTSSNSLYASEVSIEKAVFRLNGSSWSVDVTLKHKDTGWNHYADAWRIVDAKGIEIAKRILHHPHVNEQPFTRSLSSVKIPDKTKIIFIQAHDTGQKWSSKKLEIDLFNNKRDNVKVIR